MSKGNMKAKNIDRAFLAESIVIIVESNWIQLKTIKLVCLVCLVCFVFWLNETNETNQTNQIDQKTERAWDLHGGPKPSLAGMILLSMSDARSDGVVSF